MVSHSHVLLFEQCLKNDLLPFLKSASGVKDVKFYKMLTEPNPDGVTISLQLFFENEEVLCEFEVDHLNNLFALIGPEFTNQFAYFQSVLKQF